MNVRFPFAIAIAFAFISLACVGRSFAQDSQPIGPEERANLFDSIAPPTLAAEPSPSADLHSSARTTAELLQARAMYRTQQRIARLERNLWMGYEPLRPTWTATPMTSSRYRSHRTIYIPVYIRN
ncbi:hypothetical protein [Novipirellula artificiosorum]|uniref:Uncharacterized protein n=1 Tax=Novipirellula artificiosorum TaxID=2528016 RepID=A0A5C6E6B6_9BACT|nr:hypothetical protein [Novipirellula artificiosorum]TWU42719.1 hypothetical protein Poly41_10190 [Novipirellula artificiosorum]